MTRRLLPVLLAAALLGGCGVPVDDEPRRVQPPPGGFPTPAGTATAEPDGRVDEPLCFVRGDGLAAATRRVDGLPGVDAHLQHLLAGPDGAERDRGLATALPGTVAVAGATLTGTVATVDVRQAGEETGRNDEILAFGQIVCTLTQRPDVDSVAFRRDGQPLEVPRADGNVSSLPLTAADYRPLLGR
ncbi:GerMN domain-containing protein [Micromonospora chaiyaphumensis]|uniref:Sporulation and spore germination n=1 Tax=Micromonospora chaiyaphumensis TaxID=307119 RepID=A0A1C4Y198_9ACTN|nr:GerMN domain-containing protein [Micromonospora chaiyaphumensis]SCF14450.1 Sporulation and spore germination [Micromonospora chaiyaphumensis]